MATQAINQVGGRSLGDHLPVIDDGQAIAQAFGFVHVMRRQQDRASGLLEFANDVPELAAALGI